MLQTYRKTKISFLISVIFLLTIFILALSLIKTQHPPEIHDLTTIEFYSDDNTKFIELNNSKAQNYKPLSAISPHMINAIITTEDQHFYSHHGLDYKRIAKAFFDNFIAMEKVYGASTITQQYARNLYLSHQKSYERKLKEAYYALLIESNYSKDDILEGYLNTIYFGHGVYGVADAALYYFNKNISDISIKEASVLTAIIKAPTYYSPITDYTLNSERSLLILDLLYKDKKISEEEYLEAISETIHIIGRHPNSINNSAPYFQDILTRELARLDIIKDDFYRGLKVYTTLNSELNNLIESNIRDIYSPRSQIETAVYAIDPRNGHVKAVVGGRNYETSQYNRATTSLRHPGSAIKPILYYKALEYGFTPTTTFKSTKTTFYLNNGLEQYSPNNFLNRYAEKDITMAYAVATSDNIYAVKTHLFLGEQTLIDIAKRVGITTEMEPLPSLALGATDMRLGELTTAYAHFASGGKQVEPVYITKVTDMNDRVLYEHKQESIQVLNKDITFILNDLLTGMFDTRLSDEITVTGLSISHQLEKRYSGKSGSTDYDNLMIGYNPYLVLGVWTGYDEQKLLITNQEKTYSKKLWANVMHQYFENRPYEFYTPTDHVVPILVDPVTGELATPQTKYSKILYYLKGTEPI